MSQVTKRALVASLKNQLLKKPLDKVTISDITDDCGISRMTFYYHFKDITTSLNGHLRKKPVAFWRAKRTTILGSKATCAFLKI